MVIEKSASPAAAILMGIVWAGGAVFDAGCAPRAYRPGETAPAWVNRCVRHLERARDELVSAPCCRQFHGFIGPGEATVTVTTHKDEREPTDFIVRLETPTMRGSAHEFPRLSAVVEPDWPDRRRVSAPWKTDVAYYWGRSSARREHGFRATLWVMYDGNHHYETDDHYNAAAAAVVEPALEACLTSM
jgi:hypothetical protein